MIHRFRQWILCPVATVNDLARAIIDCDIMLGAGFCVLGHEDYLFLNDGTRPSLPEFAIVKRYGTTAFLFLDCVVFTDFDFDKAKACITKTLAGVYDYLADDAHPLLHLQIGGLPVNPIELKK